MCIAMYCSCPQEIMEFDVWNITKDFWSSQLKYGIVKGVCACVHMCVHTCVHVCACVGITCQFFWIFFHSSQSDNPPTTCSLSFKSHLQRVQSDKYCGKYWKLRLKSTGIVSKINDQSGVRWPGAVNTGDVAATLLASRLSHTICGD